MILKDENFLEEMELNGVSKDNRYMIIRIIYIVYFFLAKLGIFYFFFYLGLTGFFCAMIAIFMFITPRDTPRYVSEQSCMQTRSNPLSPGSYKI